jgi:hypothetical protein
MQTLPETPPASSIMDGAHVGQEVQFTPRAAIICIPGVVMDPDRTQRSRRRCDIQDLQDSIHNRSLSFIARFP